jgi:superfamily II DNA or RNA helicase
MLPRHYQSLTVDKTDAAFKEFDRVLDVLPTGSGKTPILSWLAKRRRDRGERTLILAHREELIEQAIDKLHQATGIVADKEKAESTGSLQASVVVGSVQTLAREARRQRWPRDHFGLVVVDEAHHVLADSYQAILNHFTGQVLGVTATPDRGDCRELGSYFQTIGHEVGLFDLIPEYLSPISLKSIPLQIDLSRVRSVAGDFNAGGLGAALEPYLDEIAAVIRDNCAFRRTLAFLPLIATSQKFVAACRMAGISAEHIDGESPDRAEKLARFAAWDFDLLSNAMLLTEGFDDPGIDCVIVLRPTRSRPLYAQMIGRGTRRHEGKSDLLLLDFLWMHERYSIARPANLIADSQEHADQITSLSQAGIPADIADQLPLDLQGLAGKATHEREEKLRKELEKLKERQSKILTAEQFALKHNSLSIAEYEPVMPWESNPVTDKQKKWLARAHIDLSTVRGKGHASKLLSVYFDHKPVTLASSGQRAIMRRMGFENWEGATADDARRFFAELRKPKQEALL